MRGEWAHSQVRAISAPSCPESQLPFGPRGLPSTPLPPAVFVGCPGRPAGKEGGCHPWPGQSTGFGPGPGADLEGTE